MVNERKSISHFILDLLKDRSLNLAGAVRSLPTLQTDSQQHTGRLCTAPGKGCTILPILFFKEQADRGGFTMYHSYRQTHALISRGSSIIMRKEYIEHVCNLGLVGIPTSRSFPNDTILFLFAR